MTRLSDVLEKLRGMEGAVEAFVLDDGCRDRIIKIERKIGCTMGIPIINKGVEECLQRNNASDRHRIGPRRGGSTPV